MNISRDHLAHQITPLAEQAGRLICQAYDEVPNIIAKRDGSPVTQADDKSHQFLTEQLKKLTPHIPIVSEEDETSWAIEAPLYWLIDPLDGTKGFIAKNGEFCINVALMEDDRPILGMIHIPLTQETFYGYDHVAFRHHQGNTTPIRTSAPGETFHLVRGYGGKLNAQEEAFLKPYPIGRIEQIHSAIKFTRIASGQADLYLRFEGCHTWDTAAGQVLVEAAGGVMRHLDGTPFVHGKPTVLNPPFVVFGRPL
jgi:3'(2'), 5'-bisphosphate nucleotidase